MVNGNKIVNFEGGNEFRMEKLYATNNFRKFSETVEFFGTFEEKNFLVTI